MGACNSKPKKPELYKEKGEEFNRYREQTKKDLEEELQLDNEVKEIEKSLKPSKKPNKKSSGGKTKKKKTKKKSKKKKNFYTPGYFNEALISGVEEKKDVEIDDLFNNDEIFTKTMENKKPQNLNKFEINELLFDSPAPQKKLKAFAGKTGDIELTEEEKVLTIIITKNLLHFLY